MKAEKIWFDDRRIYLTTDTGATGSLPLKGFPRLYNATPEQRERYTLSAMGIHWEELDEDLSFAGFFDREEPDNELARLFDDFPEINLSRFARSLGLNQSLLAKYLSGVKKPSAERKQAILDGLHRLGRELEAADFS